MYHNYYGTTHKEYHGMKGLHDHPVDVLLYIIIIFQPYKWLIVNIRYIDFVTVDAYYGQAVVVHCIHSGDGTVTMWNHLLFFLLAQYTLQTLSHHAVNRNSANTT